MPQAHDKTLDGILNSTQYEDDLRDIAAKISYFSENASNEATIESRFDCELFAFFKSHFECYGFEYSPEKESLINTKRHTTRGRMDTAIATLVIEFKSPCSLATDGQQSEAISQIECYMDAQQKVNGGVVEGFVTDGIKGCFLQCEGNAMKAESFHPLDWMTLDRIVRNVLDLERLAFNGKTLVRALCRRHGGDPLAHILAKKLYALLLHSPLSKTEMLFQEWMQLFNLAHDDISKQGAIISRRRSLEELMGVEFEGIGQEYRALFALQTAYAIIVKTIALKITSQVRYNHSLIDFDELSSLDSDALRSRFMRLENGDLLNSYGIVNLLEGDFFSWYTSEGQWDRELASAIKSIAEVLSKFTDRRVLNVSQDAQDFFKELYIEMVPDAVRHALGEYYTKKWLAREVVKGALLEFGHSKWRALDPTCGSGTFLTALIECVLAEVSDLPRKAQLSSVLHRVYGIDLNPIAVLTARVNYFINIAHLIDDDDTLEIPVFLGDASYTPIPEVVDGVKCFKYSIQTLKRPIDILLPESSMHDLKRFSECMQLVETHIESQNAENIFNLLINLVEKDELTDCIKGHLRNLSESLVLLEQEKWNGIWARIIANFLSVSSLGTFEVIVGNPPWVDWKNLPSGYRDKIKELCIDQRLFSGDGITGGINLNICALITNSVARNWLASNGVIGFLMPEPLVFQQSYEGFRNLDLREGERLYFSRFVNWNAAGKPFKPVTQKFLTYYISHIERNYDEGIEIDYIEKRSKTSIDDLEDLDVRQHFTVGKKRLATCTKGKNLFTLVDDASQAEAYRKIAGKSSYIGREGIEFYPQELLVFELSKNLDSNREGLTAVTTIKNPKSKYKLARQTLLLETDMLYPMIKGPTISAFHIEAPSLIVPFPYDETQPRYPIAIEELFERAPNLARYYRENRHILESQTSYNDRIIGNQQAEFYAMARVGSYSYADYYVAFRDNTKWGACVVSAIDTSWGGLRHPLFQNHAVAICEDSDGNFITEDEAFYIAGILNTPIVESYVLRSSDSRSFPIRPRIKIPKYEQSNAIHRKISELSKVAHKHYNDMARIESIRTELEQRYLSIL